MVRWVAESPLRDVRLRDSPDIELGWAHGADSELLRMKPQHLVGRHLAVLGATGGGKSWTVSRLVAELGAARARVILVDATGEYHTLGAAAEHVCIGDAPDGARGACVPYRSLTEGDLFAIFAPSGGMQAPMLREAMKTLKVVQCAPELSTAGTYVKAMRRKAEFQQAYATHAEVVEGELARFDINALPDQIRNECVWPTGYDDDTKWGKADEKQWGYCVSLVYRIRACIDSAAMKCLFDPSDDPSIFALIERFISGSDRPILRISLERLSFERNVREIVVNAIGRFLLERARRRALGRGPLVVVLDEAHQFLDKQIGEEGARFALDAFSLLAKEGRKYGASLILATQRPRDVPQDVLSQMGTMIIHRLANHLDREAVERATDAAERSTLGTVPSLSQGEAIVVGADIGVPLRVQVKPPVAQPDSAGSGFSRQEPGVGVA